MKYIEYMSENPTANFEWCKPYTDADEERFLIIYDGIANSINTPDTISHRYGGSDFDHELEMLAREVNPDYDLYSGYTDQQLAMMMMHEVGCSKCPFKHECDAMMADVNDADYR